MTARSEIAKRIFIAPADTFANTQSDHESIARLGQSALNILDNDASAHNEARNLWQRWILQSEQHNVHLPYNDFRERFSGSFPSYVLEEEQLVRAILWPQVEPSGELLALASIGAAGAGKSTLLKRRAAQEIPGAMRIDPDEGVLENLGPYLLARLALQQAAPPLAATTPEAITKELNKWRLPPYDAFRWASNVASTNNAREAVRAGLDIEFHWTGAGAFGLKLIEEGYKAAGYKIGLAVLITGLAERQHREARRLRPATPDDFTTKAIDFIKLLPKSLPNGDLVRIFAGDYPEPRLAFACRNKADGSEILHACAPDIEHVLGVMGTDIENAAIPNKNEHLAGLEFARRLLERGLRNTVMFRDNPQLRL